MRMDREIRAVHVGLGPMGLRVAKHILTEREGICYVGAIDVVPVLKAWILGN